MIQLIRKSKVMLLGSMIMMLLAMVGCSNDSHDSSDLTAKAENAILTVQTELSNSVQASSVDNSSEIATVEVVATNTADATQQRYKLDTTNTAKIEVPVEGLVEDANYEVVVKIKDNDDNVLYQGIAELTQTSTTNKLTVELDAIDNQAQIASTANTVTVYYKRGFVNPFIHYSIPGQGWTIVPGTAMNDSQYYEGYAVKTIDLGTATQLEACFNDGNGNWDSNNGQNYFFGTGEWTYEGNGVIKQGPPQIFEDANLEEYVRELINKPTGYITPSDLRNLDEINASAQSYYHYYPAGEIYSIKGVEYCTNLKTLGFNNGGRVSNNHISDLSPIANLTKLENLGFHGNEITDISPLANLTNLKILSLDYNNISNISPLSNLTNLSVLYLSGNNISNISPLNNLDNLTQLYLSNNNISNISSLANLTNLYYLYLADNNISDISILLNLSNLQSVYLANNPLNSQAQNIINQLEARGVTVYQ